MRNYDAIIVWLSAFIALFTWLTTYIIMRRKLVRAKNFHWKDKAETHRSAFELGVIAGRDEERRDRMNQRLADRRAHFPYSS